MRSREKPDPELDAAHVAAIAAGDIDAFKAVMDAYVTDIFRFSFSILGDGTRAEDIVQETFTRLWSRNTEWKPTGRLKSWLFQIAHNLCIDELRRHRGHVDVEGLEDLLVDEAPSARESMSARQTADIMNSALFELPERQRTAILLVHYQDMSNAEAAGIMNVSIEAMESLLARGRRMLKIYLADRKDSLLGE